VSAELRAPTLDDLPAVLAFFDELACRYGPHGFSEGRVRDDLTRPGENVEQNYRILLEDGVIAGWESLWSPKGRPDRIYHGPRALPRERDRYGRLLAWAEARSAEIAGGAPSRLQASAEHDDETLIEELEARGYEFARHFFEMEIDLGGEPVAPEWPAGLEPRPFHEADARAVYEADIEAFEDHWDSFPFDFAEWAEYFFEASDFDPTLWSVVEDDGEVAGFAICARRGGTTGYVHVLGVRRPWRRRGLGTALLLHSFRQLRDRGCERAALTVDGDNTTGAVRLYERSGMHVSRRSERYWKALL